MLQLQVDTYSVPQQPIRAVRVQAVPGNPVDPTTGRAMQEQPNR